MSSDEKFEQRMTPQKQQICFNSIPDDVKLNIATFFAPKENITHELVSKDFKTFSRDSQVYASYLKTSPAPTTDAKSVFKEHPEQRLFKYWPVLQDLPTVKAFHLRLMQASPKDSHDLLRLAEIVLQSESLQISRPYAAAILRSILSLDSIDTAMRAKIYLHLGNLILSEDLVLQMHDLPATIDREAFLQISEEEQAAACFRYAMAFGLGDAFWQLGRLVEVGDVVAQVEDFRGMPPSSPENQALQLYRQAIAAGSVGAVGDFITLMMTADGLDFRAEDFPGTSARKAELIRASLWEQQAAVFQRAIEQGHVELKDKLYRFVRYQCIEVMRNSYAPPLWLREILDSKPSSLTDALAARLAVKSSTMDSETRADIYFRLAQQLQYAVEEVQSGDNANYRKVLLQASQYIPELLDAAHSLRSTKQDKRDCKLSNDSDAKIISKLGKFPVPAPPESKTPPMSQQKEEILKGLTPT